MTTRVAVALRETAAGETGPVAVKIATADDDVARLRAEAERLRRAAHPGVVALVDAGPVDEGYQVTTGYGGDTLDRWLGTPAEAAELGAALAGTLADLHAAGVVHGRLDASHVLVGADGRPRLCGLSDPGDAAPADDVAAAGRLLAELAERAGHVGASRPRRRLRPQAATVAALLAAARRAVDPVPTRRPTARALAAALTAAAPAAAAEPAGADGGPSRSGVPQTEHVGLTHARSGEPGRHQATRPVRHRGAAAVAVAAGVAVAAAVAGGMLAASADTGAPRGPAPVDGPGNPDEAGAAPSGPDDPDDAGAPANGPGDPDEGGAAPHGADPDDGAPPSPTPPGGDVHVEDGRVLEMAGSRWALGEPGDVAAVGDWDCDGSPTPALLRPATGDVFVFADWSPGAREPVTVPAAGNVPGGISVRAERRAGCDALVIRTATGHDTVIPAGP